MEQLMTRTQLVIPSLCESHGVPYKILTEQEIDEESYMLFDKASISVTLSKKYKMRPFGRLCAWLSPTTGGNRICGFINHRDCKALEEIEIGGYILLSYCGLGVEISVFIPKSGLAGKWDDFI